VKSFLFCRQLDNNADLVVQEGEERMEGSDALLYPEPFHRENQAVFSPGVNSHVKGSPERKTSFQSGGRFIPEKLLI